MILDIIYSREPLTEQDVIKLEIETGISLPVAYKNFLLSHNGGHPKTEEFPIQKNLSDTHARVDFFLCLKDKDIYDITAWIGRYKKRIPSSMIPIAVDPGGNLVCLVVKGDHAGNVYFWDHEDEAGVGKEPWDKNLYFVANNFDEFVRCLR